MNPRSFIANRIKDRRRITLIVICAILGYFVLRSCIASSQNSLPSEVQDKIQKQYVDCINPNDTPIFPGEPRQPECGNVDLKVLGRGVVPESQRAIGITDAICYQAAYENPFWTTQGTTRHEVKWSSRTSYKVTVRQDGSWEIFPDEEQQDEKRWTTYSCPARKEDR